MDSAEMPQIDRPAGRERSPGSYAPDRAGPAKAGSRPRLHRPRPCGVEPENLACTRRCDTHRAGAQPPAPAKPIAPSHFPASNPSIYHPCKRDLALHVSGHRVFAIQPRSASVPRTDRPKYPPRLVVTTSVVPQRSHRLKSLLPTLAATAPRCTSRPASTRPPPVPVPSP